MTSMWCRHRQQSMGKKKGLVIGEVAVWGDEERKSGASIQLAPPDASILKINMDRFWDYSSATGESDGGAISGDSSGACGLGASLSSGKLCSAAAVPRLTRSSRASLR